MQISTAQIAYFYLGAMIAGLVVYIFMKPDFLANMRARAAKKSLLKCVVIDNTGGYSEKLLPVVSSGEHNLVKDGDSYRFVRSDAKLIPRRGKIPVHIYPHNDAVPWTNSELSDRVSVLFHDLEAVVDSAGRPIKDEKTGEPKLREVEIVARRAGKPKFERSELYSAIHSKWADEIMTAMADKVLQTVMIFSIGSFGVGLATIALLFSRYGPMIAETLQIVRDMVTPALLALEMVL